MNWPIKKILDDIIDRAYADESEKRRKLFKWFSIDTTVKTNSSYLGVYTHHNKSIKITGLNFDNSQIIITCIHELSHHIDYCKNNSTGHQTPFYEEYAKLLYAALNMRIFTAEEFITRETRDFNKVKKILDAWVPEYTDYKENQVKIKVNVPFELKDTVKARGYHWNNMERIWEMEVDSENSFKEETFLKTIGCTDYNVVSASKFEVDAVAYIKATDGSYEFKDELKKRGFFYSNKAWYKKTKARNLKEELDKIRDLMPQVRFRIEDNILP